MSGVGGALPFANRYVPVKSKRQLFRRFLANNFCESKNRLNHRVLPKHIAVEKFHLRFRIDNAKRRKPLLRRRNFRGCQGCRRVVPSLLQRGVGSVFSRQPFAPGLLSRRLVAHPIRIAGIGIKPFARICPARVIPRNVVAAVSFAKIDNRAQSLRDIGSKTRRERAAHAGKLVANLAVYGLKRVLRIFFHPPVWRITTNAHNDFRIRIRAQYLVERAFEVFRVIRLAVFRHKIRGLNGKGYKIDAGVFCQFGLKPDKRTVHGLEEIPSESRIQFEVRFFVGLYFYVYAVFFARLKIDVSECDFRNSRVGFRV